MGPPYKYRLVTIDKKTLQEKIKKAIKDSKILSYGIQYAPTAKIIKKIFVFSVLEILYLTHLFLIMN